MIVAFAGLPRVGKDTAVNFLVGVSPSQFIKYSFAEPIRKMLCNIFDWTEESFNDNNKDEIDEYWGVSKRQMLEYFGTEICRKDLPNTFIEFQKKIGEKIWIKRLEKIIQNNPYKHILIPDLRFKIEYDYLKNINATLIYIERPYYPSLDTTKSYDIPSMTFDYTLSNDIEGSTSLFTQKIDTLFFNILH